MVTSAVDHVFNVREMAVRLEEAEGSSFHMDTSRLLFLCKRSRTEIHTEVAFLTKRIKDPTDKYRKKLVGVLAYLKEAPEDLLMLSMEDTKIIKWWVEGS